MNTKPKVKNGQAVLKLVIDAWSETVDDEENATPLRIIVAQGLGYLTAIRETQPRISAKKALQIAAEIDQEMRQVAARVHNEQETQQPRDIH